MENHTDSRIEKTNDVLVAGLANYNQNKGFVLDLEKQEIEKLTGVSAKAIGSRGSMHRFLEKQCRKRIIKPLSEPEPDIADIFYRNRNLLKVIFSNCSIVSLLGIAAAICGDTGGCDSSNATDIIPVFNDLMTFLLYWHGAKFSAYFPVKQEGALNKILKKHRTGN